MGCAHHESVWDSALLGLHVCAKQVPTDCPSMMQHRNHTGTLRLPIIVGALSDLVIFFAAGLPFLLVSCFASRSFRDMPPCRDKDISLHLLPFLEAINAHLKNTGHRSFSKFRLQQKIHGQLPYIAHFVYKYLTISVCSRKMSSI